MEIVAKAFLSYAHDDDRREYGRILHLAELIRDEFESLTGTTIEVFTDSAEILWGQDFRARLNESLQETTFFIPVLTPTYFLKEECRKEMTQFVTSASALGLDQLLLSIRYLPVPDMREGSTDELKDIAARMQFEPWDGYRLLDQSGAIYRTAVNKLATRLVQLTQKLESSSGASGNPNDSAAALISDPNRPETSATANDQTEDVDRTEPADPEVDDDDAPGLIDLAEDAEPAMAAWAETLNQLTPASNALNEIFNAASLKMLDANDHPNSFAAKIVIARKLAQDVEETLQAIERLSKDYSFGLLRVDPGVRVMLEMAANADDAGARAGFAKSLQELIDSSIVASESVRGAADAARANAGLSRDLRPVLRRFETALRNIVDGVSTIKAWQPLLDEVAERPA